MASFKSIGELPLGKTSLHVIAPYSVAGVALGLVMAGALSSCTAAFKMVAQSVASAPHMPFAPNGRPSITRDQAKIELAQILPPSAVAKLDMKKFSPTTAAQFTEDFQKGLAFAQTQGYQNDAGAFAAALGYAAVKHPEMIKLESTLVYNRDPASILGHLVMDQALHWGHKQEIAHATDAQAEDFVRTVFNPEVLKKQEINGDIQMQATTAEAIVLATQYSNPGNLRLEDAIKLMGATYFAESALDPNNVSDDTGAAGLGQHLKSEWVDVIPRIANDSASSILNRANPEFARYAKLIQMTRNHGYQFRSGTESQQREIYNARTGFLGAVATTWKAKQHADTIIAIPSKVKATVAVKIDMANVVEGDIGKMLRANPNAQCASVLPASFVSHNPNLFRGKSVQQAFDFLQTHSAVHANATYKIIFETLAKAPLDAAQSEALRNVPTGRYANAGGNRPSNG